MSDSPFNQAGPCPICDNPLSLVFDERDRVLTYRRKCHVCGYRDAEETACTLAQVQQYIQSITLRDNPPIDSPQA